MYCGAWLPPPGWPLAALGPGCPGVPYAEPRGSAFAGAQYWDPCSKLLLLLLAFMAVVDSGLGLSR